MTRVEKATQRIHNRAILEAEKYSSSHSGSIIEEVAYGRGFKAGFIEGYKQAEKDVIERVCEWLKKNATYTHPRTDKESCIINLNALREAMEEDEK